jgi:hypothetical protein
MQNRFGLIVCSVSRQHVVGARFYRQPADEPISCVPGRGLKADTSRALMQIALCLAQCANDAERPAKIVDELLVAVGLGAQAMIEVTDQDARRSLIPSSADAPEHCHAIGAAGHGQEQSLTLTFGEFGGKFCFQRMHFQ